MRNRSGWLACLVTVGALLAPTGAKGQHYEVPPPPGVERVPWPLGHPRYETGGFYTAGEVVSYKQTNPIKNQLVAVRGFIDRDGSISAVLGLPPQPGSFIGSRQPALFTDDAGGSSTFTPGFNFVLGWRFQSGLAVELSWIHLAETRYSGTASFSGSPFSPGNFGENTFLFAPVVNYPVDFDGPNTQLTVGSPGATSGIWNAATLMTVDFLQRYDRFQINARYPLQDTECWRTYGLFGPRISWLWERFRWRTVDANLNGLAAGDDVAIYSNVVSQRLYGVHIGIGNEWELGVTPLGAFSLSLDLEGAISVNFVKGRAKYEIGDFHTAASRARNLFTVVPEIDGNINLWWYPYEGIQLRVGYSFMAFFNTVASQNPIDFNYGGVDPEWDRGISRLFHGINAGFAIIF